MHASSCVCIYVHAHKSSTRGSWDLYYWWWSDMRMPLWFSWKSLKSQKRHTGENPYLMTHTCVFGSLCRVQLQASFLPSGCCPLRLSFSSFRPPVCIYSQIADFKGNHRIFKHVIKRSQILLMPVGSIQLIQGSFLR